MHRFVRIVLSLLICAAVFGIAPAMAYKHNGKSWAYLAEPRKPVFIICDTGLDDTAKGIVKAAAAIWANGDKFAFSFDDTKECDTNANWGKCDKINVIDFGSINKGIAVAAPCAGDTATDMQTCDIRISKAVALYIGTGTVPQNKYDLFTGMAHEFGHCVGLDEVRESADKASVMYFEIGPRESRRALSKDDVAGRDILYK